MSKVRQCAILVGGLGSRLGHLTAHTPKPLLDIGGKPFLTWIIRELSRYCVEEIVLLAGYRSDRVEEFVQQIESNLPKPVKIRLSIETERRGTGGALWQAREVLDERFLLINGDSWLDLNLAKFFAQASEHSRDICNIVLHNVTDGSRYGTVNVDHGHVTKFMAPDGRQDRATINAGMYLLSRGIFDRLRPICSLERDVLPELAQTGGIRAHCFDGYFIDIGIPRDLERAKTEMPQRLIRAAVFLDRDGVLNRDLGWVGTIDRLEWVEQAVETIQLINDAGLHAFVITNQGGVAKGYYSETDVGRLHNWMSEFLLTRGATIDDWRYCPHHPDGAIEKYREHCDCRKPGIAMISDLAERWCVKMADSVLVGDKKTDILAAKRVGISGHFYNGLKPLRTLVSDALQKRH